MLRMTEVTRSCLSYAALRLKWQALRFVLVALGRAVVRLERTHGRGVPGYPCTDFIPSIAQTVIAIAYPPTFIDSG